MVLYSNVALCSVQSHLCFDTLDDTERHKGASSDSTAPLQRSRHSGPHNPPGKITKRNESKLTSGMCLCFQKVTSLFSQLRAGRGWQRSSPRQWANSPAVKRRLNCDPAGRPRGIPHIRQRSECSAARPFVAVHLKKGGM